jgi:ferredoxin
MIHPASETGLQSVSLAFSFCSMPDPKARQPENQPGRYYVDTQCIDCDICRETARRNFTRETQTGHSFVYKQPVNAQEEQLCQEAMKSCPVQAIGDDGEGQPNVNVRRAGLP